MEAQLNKKFEFFNFKKLTKQSKVMEIVFSTSLLLIFVSFFGLIFASLKDSKQENLNKQITIELINASNDNIEKIIKSIDSDVQIKKQDEVKQYNFKQKLNYIHPKSPNYAYINLKITKNHTDVRFHNLSTNNSNILFRNFINMKENKDIDVKDITFEYQSENENSITIRK